MTNEIFSPVYGIRICNIYIGIKGTTIEGRPAYVRFDPKTALKNHKWLLGFYHTHPNMSAFYSETDRQTMEGWVSCLGKDLICLITGTNVIRGITTLAWWYSKKQDKLCLGYCMTFGKIIIGTYSNGE